MDFSWAWKAVLIVLVGSILLRIAGRKSIAQMTVAQTIIMIAIGNLLIQPVSERGLGVTFLTAGVLVLTLLVLEYVQLKSNTIEHLITGKAVIVIEDGVINVDNLRSIRMPVDQLEIQLRQANITRISDVRLATIEANGRLGFTLKDYAQPATRQDIATLINLINNKLPGGGSIGKLQSSPEKDIFSEVKNEPNKQPSPRELR